MSNFDFDAHKQATIKRLEALEKIRLDFDALKNKLAELDIGSLVEQHAKTEIAKIMRYAKQHDIPFTIDVNDLLSKIKLPPLSDSRPSHPTQHLPFLPNITQSIEDDHGNYWDWDTSTQTWKMEGDEEEEEEWEHSSCEWQSSSANC